MNRTAEAFPLNNTPTSVNRPTVLFDGNCGLCNRCISWAEKRSSGRMSFIPAGSVDPNRFGLNAADLDAQMWLLEPSGTKLSGSQAALRVLELTRQPWRALARLGALPFLSGACRMAYRLVAKNRYRFNALCGESCTPRTPDTDEKGDRQ